MKSLEPLLGILLGVGVLILAHFFPDIGTELKVTGGALLTSGMPQVSQLMKPNRQSSDAGYASLPGFFMILALAGFLASAGVYVSSCASAKTSTLVQNLKTCAAADEENAAAKQEAIACLGDVVVGDYVGCLAAVPAGVVWSLDEIACVAKAEAAAVR